MTDVTTLYRDDLRFIESEAAALSAKEPVVAVLLFQAVEAVLYEYEGGVVSSKRAAEINQLAPKIDALIKDPSDAESARSVARLMLKVFPRYDMLMSA